MEQKQDILFSMGPQHPSTHGVLRLMVRADGEVVTWCEPDIGYLHRCFEKLSESKTYTQVIPFTDRTDYLSAITNEWPYVQAVEKMLEIEVPERAEYIRVITAELNRIVSHIMLFGTFVMDLGAQTAFLYAWRDREYGYTLFEKLTGGRMLYNYFRIGGLRNDLPSGWAEEVLDYLDYIEKEALPQYDRLVTNSRILHWRTKNVACISPELAISLGTTGGMLRSCGVKYDLRRHEPYSIYDRFEWDIPVGEQGDTFDRYHVRMLEIRESIKIIRQAIAQLPEGEIMGKVPRIIKPPEGEIYVRHEGARGEVGVWVVSDGTPNPYRVKWRSPAFTHLQLLPVVAPGLKIADLIAFLASIDIVLGEVDR